MQVKIKQIGEEFGLLLPKELLDTCGFGSEATVTIEEKVLVASPSPHRSRAGWGEALARIPQAQLDQDFDELQTFREG
ncbi:MAG: hypothetical protein NTW03_05585 [Verrucomicrobia bacterium]|nr:hypothetical protein [Verrucomicrobiota bacterium]